MTFLNKHVFFVLLLTLQFCSFVLFLKLHVAVPYSVPLAVWEETDSNYYIYYGNNVHCNRYILKSVPNHSKKQMSSFCDTREYVSTVLSHIIFEVPDYKSCVIQKSNSQNCSQFLTSSLKREKIKTSHVFHSLVRNLYISLLLLFYGLERMT